MVRVMSMERKVGFVTGKGCSGIEVQDKDK
jgi:hypothetical protein